MPYQDTSPAGQHFMNFSRPLSLAVVARAADDLTFELIYGFGEYRFHADPARHDSLADLARLADALEAGFDYVEATFADAGGRCRPAVVAGGCRPPRLRPQRTEPAQ